MKSMRGRHRCVCISSDENSIDYTVRLYVTSHLIYYYILCHFNLMLSDNTKPVCRFSNYRVSNAYTLSKILFITTQLSSSSLVVVQGMIFINSLLVARLSICHDICVWFYR